MPCAYTPVDLWVFERVLNELPYVCQHLINTTKVSIVQHTRSCRGEERGNNSRIGCRWLRGEERGKHNRKLWE
jgi:hypothetical protein